MTPHYATRTLLSILMIPLLLTGCGGDGDGAPPTVDLEAPIVSLVGPPPNPVGLLGTQDVTWQANEAGTYVIELGGTGVIGMGTQIAAGQVAAYTAMPQRIRGSQLAFTAATPLRIYVTDATGHTGSTSVDLTMKPLAAVPLGGALNGIHILPNGRKTYVARVSGDAVLVVDTDPTSPSFLTVLTTIPVGQLPQQLAATPDGARVYVTNSGASLTELGSISTVDTTVDAVTGTIGLGPGSLPVGIAATPDGTRAYFTRVGGVGVLDIAPSSPTYGTVIGNIVFTLSQSGTVGMTQDGAKAVVNWQGSSLHGVFVIDVAPLSPTYNAVLGTPIPDVVASAGGLAISPGSDFAYVSDTASAVCGLCKVDIRSRTISARKASASTMPLALTTDGKTLLGGEAALSVFDAADLTFLGSPDIGGVIGNIALAPDGARAYVIRNPLSQQTSALVMVPLQ